MSLPDEEQWALRQARRFLRCLGSGEYKVTTITALRQDARRILKHYPYLDPEVPEHGRVIKAVLDEHEGEVGTHWETCWKHHAGCLARVLRDMEDQ